MTNYESDWKDTFCLVIGIILLIWNLNVLIFIFCVQAAAQRDERYQEWKKYIKLHHMIPPFFVMVASLLLILGIAQQSSVLILPFLIVYLFSTIITIVDMCYTMCFLWFTFYLPIVVMISTVISLFILVTTYDLYEALKAAE